MHKHPFRIAIESGAGPQQLQALFAPGATLLAPMLTKPVTATSRILEIIGHAAQVAGPIQYTLEVTDPRQTFLFWTGHVQGHALNAVTILVDDDQGLIREMRVLMRAWPVVTLFRDAMYARLSRSIPSDYWELAPKSQQPRKFTPIALKPLERAPDLVLHSPMLAKSVSGKREVEAAVGLAHEVQSASSYTSIIATPEVVIELFDCDADGYPMEGMWVQKLDAQGRINDLTVMLRPYPAVTVLRNRTKALAEERGALGPEYWELSR